jgi:hypothetical protein
MSRTLLRPHQINLAEIFSVSRVLSSRGFSITSEGKGRDTLIARDSWTLEEETLVYQVFDDQVLRGELLGFINGNDTALVSPKTQKLAQIADFARCRQAYSTTFEWYVGELIRSQFQGFASSYGVSVADIQRNSDEGTSGDYDVLSVLGDAEILYLECKSGGCKRAHILNTIERALSLHCIASVLLLGAGVNETALSQQLYGLNYPTLTGKIDFLRVSIKGLPDSAVYQWHDCYFVEANEAGGQIEARLRTILRLIAARRVNSNRIFGFDVDQYYATGYEAKIIE